MIGEYPYGGQKKWFNAFPPFGDANKSAAIGGEDNQHVLFRMLYKSGTGSPLVRGNGTEEMHTLDPCDNNKQGMRTRCSQSQYTMYHKMPEWEASRLHLLHVAALNGQCRNNPALMNWEA